ncbi:hypothetical protein [Paraburkholderia lacunae]|uniref:hypothetical protein n=1 Tax=Paraburkholderia lacunae TaxID=2211104 RepID=UPI00105889A2|nr:hypothetical protein [Paraburkholderia lacunae]
MPEKMTISVTLRRTTPPMASGPALRGIAPSGLKMWPVDPVNGTTTCLLTPQLISCLGVSVAKISIFFTGCGNIPRRNSVYSLHIAIRFLDELIAARPKGPNNVTEPSCANVKPIFTEQVAHDEAANESTLGMRKPDRPPCCI